MLNVQERQVAINLTQEEVESIYKSTGNRMTELKVDLKEEQPEEEAVDKDNVSWSIKA